MPDPIIVRFPVDLTGVNSTNLVQGEVRTLPSRTVRAVAPYHGGFFTESVHVFDTANSQELVKNTDYYCTEMYSVPTKRSGKTVCSVIVVTNQAVSNNISINYQAVGGEYSSSSKAITDILNDLALDDRPASWPDIIAKPNTYPASEHLHDIGDIYGFEYVVFELQRIKRAIEMGDNIGREQLLIYIDNLMLNLLTVSAGTALLNNGIAAHVALSDPHVQYMKKLEMAGELMVTVTASGANTSLSMSPVSGVIPTVFKLIMGANTLVSFDNIPATGFVAFSVLVKNDGTGARTLAWPSGSKWAGGLIPPRTTAANAEDLFFFYRPDNATPFTGSLSVADAKP